MTRYRQTDNGKILDTETGLTPDVREVDVKGRKELIVREGQEHSLLKENGSGGFYEIPIHDVDTYLCQRDPGSSKEFIDKQFTDPRKARQTQRRTAALQNQLKRMVQDLVEPTTTGGHKFVQWKDEKFLDAQEKYAKAAAAGKGKEFNFQPLVTYRHNVEKVRRIYKGEVGILCDGGDVGLRRGNPFYIVVLESGYGVGNFAQVGAQIIK